jgi:hypothetical protein
MSETAGTGASAATGHDVPGHDVPGRSVTGHSLTERNVTEAYAFACMSCGHGWEQGYEIEHHQDASGVQFVTYLADGAQVPSPLTRPTCQNCDGHTVRIMRSGQVSDVVASLWKARRDAPVERQAHHWSVLNFLHHRQEDSA